MTSTLICIQSAWHLQLGTKTEADFSQPWQAPQCSITVNEGPVQDRSAWRPDPQGIYTDWILFALGFLFTGTWFAGLILPLTRTPRFPSATNKAGRIANLIGAP